MESQLIRFCTACFAAAHALWLRNAGDSDRSSMSHQSLWQQSQRFVHRCTPHISAPALQPSPAARYENDSRHLSRVRTEGVAVRRPKLNFPKNAEWYTKMSLNSRRLTRSTRDVCELPAKPSLSGSCCEVKRRGSCHPSRGHCSSIHFSSDKQISPSKPAFAAGA